MRQLLILIKAILKIPARIFSKISIFALVVDSIVDKTVAICTGARVYRTCIGKYSYIGRSSFVTNANIGNFCSIAGNVNIGGTSHMLDWVSTSSVFHRWENILKKNFSFHEYDIFKTTEIGNDVWIATNAMIKAGVKIADGAVVGMGAVVTKDIGPYEVWAGNPARLIKKRFDDGTIEKLLELKWWNFDDEQIEKYAQYFNDTKSFLEIMNGEI